MRETWVGDLGLIPGLGRSPGEGNGYPLQYSGLENSMDCINPWGRKQLDTTERLSNIYIVWGEWCWVVVAACRLSLFAMNGDYSSRLLCPLAFSRQEYWSGCHTLLQEIFLTWGSNPCPFGLLHLQAGSLPLAPPGNIYEFISGLYSVPLVLVPIFKTLVSSYESIIR